MKPVERDWLDYAWSVFNCPQRHMARCIAAGASVPGPDRPDGNELRWPGYLGADYSGVLCVSHVHAERDSQFAAENPEVIRATDSVVRIARSWLEQGRSEATDAAFLSDFRDGFKSAMNRWDLWISHYRTLVEDLSDLTLDHIAFTNLAKCRIPYPSEVSPIEMAKLCQEQFPIRDLLDRIRPRVVLLSVLPAAREREVVRSWRTLSAQPKVIAWHGRTGHDRHNTVAGRRDFSDWAPEAAETIKSEVRTYRLLTPSDDEGE